jgi:hypothetical protein
MINVNAIACVTEIHLQLQAQRRRLRRRHILPRRGSGWRWLRLSLLRLRGGLHQANNGCAGYWRAVGGSCCQHSAAESGSTRQLLPGLGSCRQHGAPICSMPDLLLLLGGELLVGGVLPQARRHTPRLGVCPPAHMAHRGY